MLVQVDFPPDVWVPAAEELYLPALIEVLFPLDDAPPVVTWFPRFPHVGLVVRHGGGCRHYHHHQRGSRYEDQLEASQNATSFSSGPMP